MDCPCSGISQRWLDPGLILLRDSHFREIRTRECHAGGLVAYLRARGDGLVPYCMFDYTDRTGQYMRECGNAGMR